MIPDKIYIGHDVYNNVDKYWEENSNTEIPGKSYIEYVRKHALLEWAKENIDSLGRLSYGEFIDKLNSM